MFAHDELASRTTCCRTTSPTSWPGWATGSTAERHPRAGGSRHPGRGRAGVAGPPLDHPARGAARRGRGRPAPPLVPHRGPGAVVVRVARPAPPAGARLLMREPALAPLVPEALRREVRAERRGRRPRPSTPAPGAAGGGTPAPDRGRMARRQEQQIERQCLFELYAATWTRARGPACRPRRGRGRGARVPRVLERGRARRAARPAGGGRRPGAAGRGRALPPVLGREGRPARDPGPAAARRRLRRALALARRGRRRVAPPRRGQAVDPPPTPGAPPRGGGRREGPRLHDLAMDGAHAVSFRV